MLPLPTAVLALTQPTPYPPYLPCPLPGPGPYLNRVCCCCSLGLWCCATTECLPRSSRISGEWGPLLPPPIPPHSPPAGSAPPTGPQHPSPPPLCLHQVDDASLNVPLRVLDDGQAPAAAAATTGDGIASPQAWYALLCMLSFHACLIFKTPGSHQVRPLP